MRSAEAIEISDFLKIKSVSGIRYSPDANRIAYIVQYPDVLSNGYLSELWIWERVTGKARKIDHEFKAPLFIWLDAETVLCSGILSGKYEALIKGGEAWTVFFELNVTTGRIIESFALPLLVKMIERTADDTYILSAPYAPGLIDPTMCDDKIGSAQGAGGHELILGKEFEVVDRLPIWSDGAGFLRGRVNRLYAFKRGGIPVPLTDENLNVEMFRVKDRDVLFVGKKSVDAFESAGIFIRDLDSEAIRCMVPQDQFLISDAEFLGDSVVFFGVDRGGGLRTDNPKFYVVSSEAVELCADADFSVKDAVGYDCKYGNVTAFKTVGSSLYFISTKERSSFLTRIDKKGDIEVLTEDTGAIQDFDATDGEVVFCGIQGMGLQELYLLADGEEKKLTGINDSFLRGKKVSNAETMVFENGGDAVHYVVCKPTDFDPGHKYPAILYIHGGAKVIYGPVFFHEMQVLASRGFFVLYGNPKGSDGQGSQFARLKGKYGQRDYEDMMKAVDVALERYPQIDSDRLGVAGGSYGGIMTNWIIGHTTRFKCAVSDRSLCNMISAFGTADNGYDFVREQMDADPWTNLELLWEQSPLKYAKNVRTPLLLVHSEHDYRCHYSEAVQFFTALKYFGVEAKILFIRGECHDLSRSGRPRQRILRLNTIVNWFERFLLA